MSITDKIHPEIWKKGKGDIDDIILYALNQVSPMMRTEFIKIMNKNTFHKWVKVLRKEGRVEVIKSGKKSVYTITSLGQDELLRRLKNYSLDFETVNKIEQKRIRNYIDSISKFFWNDQNYRYYKGYTQNDKDYYEKTYNKMASSDNGLYKHFVLWVIKMRNMMVKQKFTYQDIEIFERNTLKKAIWSGRSTNAFIKWLEDKTQLKITDFF